MKAGLRSDHSTIMLLFLGAIVVAWIGAWGISTLYHVAAAPPVLHPELFVPSYRGQIRPEPDERFVFTVLAAAIPTISLAVVFAITRRLNGWSEWTSRYVAVLAVVAASVFAIPLYEFEFSTWLIDKVKVGPGHSTLLLGALSLSAGWSFWSVRRSRLMKPRSTTRIIFAVFIGCALAQIAAWRVVGIRSVFHYASWNVHFDAVIYTLSQVVMGKTLLADLPSQYGLFPEFMAPLFRMIGLSTMSFTAVCAVMQVASMVCIWWVLNRGVKDGAIRIVASIALVMVTFETVLYFIGIQERYFQYWPVRFFWPAVSVLAFYRYSRSGRFRDACVMSLVAAVGTLWNTDSGLMIVLSFAGFLGFRLIGDYTSSDTQRSQRRAVWAAAAAHVVITVFVAGAFYLYLSSKADGPLHLAWLYEYQITFYKLGFTMLRMPTYPSAWMTVMAVYLMGVIVGFVGIARGRHSWRLDNILFLSMLGVGLFVYYQGRSHILNLVTVAWPAIIVGAMLADRVLRAVRADAAPQLFLLLPAVALGILAFCAAPFLWSVPKLIGDSVALFTTRHLAVSDVVQDEISFIRDHSSPGEACAILSQRQGIYYAEAKLVSPLPGPGYIETVLQADRDAMIHQLATQRPACVFVGVGASALDLGPELANALRGYKLVASSKSATLQYLTP